MRRRILQRLIWVYTVCSGLSVRIHMVNTVKWVNLNCIESCSCVFWDRGWRIGWGDWHIIEFYFFYLQGLSPTLSICSCYVFLQVSTDWFLIRWAITWENTPSDICAQWSLISACAFAQSSREFLLFLHPWLSPSEDSDQTVKVQTDLNLNTYPAE